MRVELSMDPKQKTLRIRKRKHISKESNGDKIDPEAVSKGRVYIEIANHNPKTTNTLLGADFPQIEKDGSLVYFLQKSVYSHKSSAISLMTNFNRRNSFMMKGKEIRYKLFNHRYRKVLLNLHKCDEMFADKLPEVSKTFNSNLN